MEMDFTAWLIVALLMLCIWSLRRKAIDTKLTGPYEARVGKHGLRVRALSGQCGYCHGRRIQLYRLVPREPRPGGDDLCLLDELPVGDFCTGCKAEDLPRQPSRREARNLDQFMDRLDAGEGRDV